MAECILAISDLRLHAKQIVLVKKKGLNRVADKKKARKPFHQPTP